MDAGNVKIAEDSDFVMLKALVDNDADWRLEYERRDDTGTKVRIHLSFWQRASCTFVFTSGVRERGRRSAARVSMFQRVPLFMP